MKKKLTAILLCIGMLTGAVTPLAAEELYDVSVEEEEWISDYKYTSTYLLEDENPITSYEDDICLYIEDGDIYLSVGEGGYTSYLQNDMQGLCKTAYISNKDKSVSCDKSITINSSANNDINIVLSNLNINATVALCVNGSGNVNIELDGSNVLKSSSRHAGLEVSSNSSIVINDIDNNGFLEAQGSGAGIGSAQGNNNGTITINGGTITAVGGFNSAGIGGGDDGGAGLVIINGGAINTSSNWYGCGIGSGSYNDDGGAIIINGGKINATGNVHGAGIGGSDGGKVDELIITGGEITSTGKGWMVGVGGSDSKSIVILGGNIRVSGGGYDIGFSNGAVNVTSVTGRNEDGSFTSNNHIHTYDTLVSDVPATDNSDRVISFYCLNTDCPQYGELIQYSIKTKFVSAVTPDEPNITDIPEDAVYYNGSYYKIYTISSSATRAEAYHEAIEHCESMGGHLAVIRNQAENDFLSSYVKEQNISNAYFGYSDEDIEGTWVWVDCEEASTYVNWANGEPNSTKEDYGMFYFYGGSDFSNGQWNNGDFGSGTIGDDRNYICEWNVGEFVTSSISTTFETSAVTLHEGDTFDFDGIVSTTAEDGLAAVQIDIHRADDDTVGITYIRKTDTDETSPLSGNSFDLSYVPSFKAGDTLTGTTQSITLSAGTSWNIYLYAKDADGNTLGSSIVKRVDIVEKEVPFVAEKTYVQTTNTDKFTGYDAPYFAFNEDNTGKFHWVDSETGESGTDTFTYTISGDTITLTANGLYYLGNVAKEIVLNIIDNDYLEVAEIINLYDLNSTSIGCTSVGDQFKVGVEQTKPVVSGLKSSYSVTQRDTLNLSFTVTAGNGANLKTVTVKNNAVKEDIYRKSDISANAHTVSCTIDTNTVGTHTFVVYASADNYTVTDNIVATFTVTVKAKNSESLQSLIDRVKYVIICNEKNTDYRRDGSDYIYGYVTRKDGKDASAIGIFQWRESRAFDLIEAIIKYSELTEDEAKNIIGEKLYNEVYNGDRTDWKGRIFKNDEENNEVGKIKSLLQTNAGINEQLYLAEVNAEEYCKNAEKHGITQDAAKIVYADMRNINPEYSDKIAESAVAKVGGDGSKVTWEILLEEYRSHGVMGAGGYAQRHNRLERLLTEWYGSSTEEPPVVEPDEPVVPDTDNIVIAGIDIGYKNGDYFTKNGKACDYDGSTCHNTGICSDDKDGCNCKHEFVFGGKEIKLEATQCLGYAKYCSYMVFGKFPNAIYTNVTAKDVKDKLLTSKPGSYLDNRAKTHAIVIVSADQDSITYTDANYAGSPCQVRIVTKKWEDFYNENYIKNGNYSIYGEERKSAVLISKVVETYSGDEIHEGVRRTGYVNNGSTSLMFRVEVTGAKRVYMQLKTLSGSAVEGVSPYEKTIDDTITVSTHEWNQIIPNGTSVGVYQVIISASNSSIPNDPNAQKDNMTFYIKVTGDGETVKIPSSTPKDEQDVYLKELNKLLADEKITQTEFNNRKAVLEEASKYCNLEWTAPVTFHTWKDGDGEYNSNSNMVISGNPNDTLEFVQGVTYKGIPYCADAPNNRQSIYDWETRLNEAFSPKDLEGTADYKGIKRQSCTIYGIDCSGLVWRSYRSLEGYNFGYKTTSDLSSENSPFSKTTEPKPGDLLLKSGHVMIYAGTNESGSIMVYESVADGKHGISGCVYRERIDISKYSYYRYEKIAE